jgi:Xaa-Pro aminopeptidase
MTESIKPDRSVSCADFPFEEFSLRKKRALAWMEANGFDGLLLFNPMNLNYFSGFRRTWTTNWPQVAILNSEGQSCVIVPQIWGEFAEESTWVDQVKPYGGSSVWGLEQDPITLVVNTLKKMGLAEKTIGAELGSPNNFMLLSIADFESIKSALPQAEFKDAVPHIWQQRLIKTAWEQDTMRKLADISVKGVQAAIAAAHTGITEKKMLQTFWHTCLEEGACDTPMAGDMMFRGGATKYGMATPRQVDDPIPAGAQMFFDGGASYKGYYFDFQRHICFGQPSELHRRLTEISEEGQKAAEAMIKPGKMIKDVHAAAMGVIDFVPDDLKKQGVDFLYSHTFMGHCEGLCIHEPPWITEDSEQEILPGMVMALEIPALDIPQFRVLGGFPEDVYLVTEDGHEVLTAGIERKLYVID